MNLALEWIFAGNLALLVNISTHLVVLYGFVK